MTDLILHREPDHTAIALPESRVSITIRQAEMKDLPFIDDLQKKHTKMVGWFPTKQIEANIKGDHVLIAEECSGGSPLPLGEGLGVRAGSEALDDRAHPHPSPLPKGEGVRRPVGYVIARDTYMKREDCGIIYQLNVTTGSHRKLVGATLIKHVFDRAAYGCKLFCCWCAQDIEANYFWESIGFVPLAFRTGARRSKKLGPRIHIFWQRRIREGDDATPYWFPSQTMGGAVREGRIVLPIPPGTHWSDAKPAVLPGMEKVGQRQLESDSEKQKKSRPKKQSKPVQVHRPGSLQAGGLRFGPPPEEVEAQKAEAAKRKAEKKPKQKNDPKLVAAARELRDRYLEEANDAGSGLLPGACGKYDVSRALEHAPSAMKDGHDVVGPGVPGVRLLDAA